MTRRRSGEEGYALVAAVASVAVFAALALAIMTVTRVATISSTAEIEAAQAAAATDAGLVLAVDGLLARAPEQRWLPDGRIRKLGFDGAQITIRIEDESGKVPINRIDEEMVPDLLRAVGLEGQALRIASDSLLDWIDDDDEARADGAEADHYRPSNIHPRNGPLETIDELRYVRGFDTRIVERLRPFVTVYSGPKGFDQRFARPEAIGVMLGGGDDSPAAINRARELAGQRVALDTAIPDIVGRPIAIDVDGVTISGAHSHLWAVVTLTGNADRPYAVRMIR